jgi:hypothetical protein
MDELATCNCLDPDASIVLCKKCGSWSVGDENLMLFQCPIYQHVRVKYVELLEFAYDL